MGTTLGRNRSTPEACEGLDEQLLSLSSETQTYLFTCNVYFSRLFSLNYSEKVLVLVKMLFEMPFEMLFEGPFEMPFQKAPQTKLF